MILHSMVLCWDRMCWILLAFEHNFMAFIVPESWKMSLFVFPTNENEGLK